jgi:hypothetical protein
MISRLELTPVKVKYLTCYLKGTCTGFSTEVLAREQEMAMMRFVATTKNIVERLEQLIEECH